MGDGATILDNASKAKIAFVRAEGLRVRGSHLEALKLYSDAERLAGAEDYSTRLNSSFQIADLDYVYGRMAAARARLLDLEAIAASRGLALLRGRIAREFGHIELELEQHEAAYRSYEGALNTALRANRKSLIAECYVSAAESLCSLRPSDALEMVDQGLKYAELSGLKVEVGKSSYVRSEALLNLDRAGDSLKAAEDSLTVLLEVGYGSGTARAQMAAARAHLALGDPDAALRHSLDAVSYYVREGIYPRHRCNALEIAFSAERRLGRSGIVANLDNFEHVPHLKEFPDLFEKYGQ